MVSEAVSRVRGAWGLIVRRGEYGTEGVGRVCCRLGG